MTLNGGAEDLATLSLQVQEATSAPIPLRRFSTHGQRPACSLITEPGSAQPSVPTCYIHADGRACQAVAANPRESWRKRLCSCEEQLWPGGLPPSPAAHLAPQGTAEPDSLLEKAARGQSEK